MVVTLVNKEIEKSVAVVMTRFEACLAIWTVIIRTPRSSAAKISGMQEKFLNRDLSNMIEKFET